VLVIFFLKAFSLFQAGVKTNGDILRAISNPRAYSKVREKNVTEFVNEFFKYVHVWLYYQKFKELIKNLI
jgi:hypothetical protein